MALSSVLITYVKADVANFTSNLQKARGVADNFGTSINKSINGLQAAFASLGAGAALKTAFNQIDDIGAVASKLDITTQSLQKLEYVAKRTDTSFGAIEGGLSKLRRRLGEATNGNKDASEAFRKLGLDANKLAEGDLGDAYFQVGDAIKTITSSTEQATAAIDVFGRNGQENLNALRSDMRGLVEEASRLGFILSDADIAKFNKLDEAVDKLAFTIKGNLYQSLIDLAPALTNVSNAVVKTTGGVKAGLAKISLGISDGFSALDDLGRRFSGVVNGFKAFDPTAPYTMADFKNRNRFSNVNRNAAIGDASNNAGSAVQAIGQATKNIIDLGKSAATASSSLAALGQTQFQDLLGINSMSGKSYLDSILGPIEQVQNDRFTRLASQLRDNIASGGSGFGLNNESIIEALKDIANESGLGLGSGQSNSGMINAVQALEEASKNLKSENKLTVELKYDQNGIVKAFVSSPAAMKIVGDIVQNVASSEAGSTVASGG